MNTLRDGARAMFTLGLCFTVAAAFGPAAASSTAVDSDFDTCPPGPPPSQVEPAPQAKPGPKLPTGSEVRVRTSQPMAGAYQQAPVQVGSQVFDTVIDTGSSWLVLNRNAVANNDQITLTGEIAGVSYAGGAACFTGPVARGPVSIGELEPRMVTFLIAEKGAFPWDAILGVNTWDPVSSLLDVPMQALRIDSYQLTLPPTKDARSTGLWVVNGQPDIDAADARRVATFRNRALVRGNRVWAPGVISAGGSARGAFMLDTGTPYQIVALFPRAARSLGYNYASATWSNPSAPMAVTLQPNGTPSFTLRPSVPPLPVGKSMVLTPEQTVDPRAGMLGLAGTDVVLGADYLRPWVMGVQLTKQGSTIRLLAIERRRALREGCSGLAPASVAREGTTVLVPRGCRVNGAPVRVRVKGPVDSYRLITKSGTVSLRTWGVGADITVHYSAPPYLEGDRLRVARTYRG